MGENRIISLGPTYRYSLTLGNLMSVNSSLLREMIEAIVDEEMTLESPFSSDSHSLSTLINKDKQHVSDMSPQDFEKLLRNLVKRKYGKATLQRGDIEKLDQLTRWMKYLPGGHQYRRGLAKYLRSKRDNVRRDPFRDFRQYRYDNSMEEQVDSLDERSADNSDIGQAELFYHGSSVELEPGDLILPPSKTGKVSEKGRKKNLDMVFFTKDPRSALIYAGRAVQSLGGEPFVYLVEPQGSVEALNTNPGTTVFYAPYAKVVQKLGPRDLRKK